jgi:hypothetical protein
MNYKKYCYLPALLCMLSFNVYAEYKTSGDMTDEEYQAVRVAMAEHNECMNEYAMSQLETQTDPRVVADHSMKNCGHILDGLYQTLLQGNYAPEAMQRFVGSISNKAANKLLAKLMKFMAAKGQ